MTGPRHLWANHEKYRHSSLEGTDLLHSRDEPVGAFKVETKG